MREFRKGFGSFRIVVGMIAVSVMAGGSGHAFPRATTPMASDSAVVGEIPKAALVEPAELSRLLANGPEKPLVLQVGSRVLFTEAHIVGSEYAGPGGQGSGLALLRTRMKDVKRNQAVVIYCGCCPWGKCPNIRAAYAALVGMGFTGVKALYIEEDFGTDWVEKGYPVAKGAK